MLVTCQNFGDLFLFGLICMWQHSSDRKTYRKVGSKLLAAVIKFKPTYIICFVIRRKSNFFVTVILVCCIFGCFDKHLREFCGHFQAHI